nr:PREDICTED: sperm-tail PG-rich repeat-containing protein 2-like isoform X1 [Megachile rotundata]XP_012148880.1 PREDICTED: sperm-tail PG-rich repeat-containing protein 2-like isoform X1 [Megachile rotundata]XP_012148881.1 PREDICTED: sperm-tail PG-rich repeat-containing protein 2-like isoform X1 [Megachile rotundata]XP_012148882.1 PREDICTED: sperm-tail PG-rich repeat-containing protein 2-like isoform X1 [Megachile rotundata]XP_012148883.1 PREDICTED: sperm-tail PG-rich repeat-containing protein 
MTTSLYKGNFWSRKTGRTSPRISSTPGPGDYEHKKIKTAAELQNEKIREAKRMSSKQLRFLDVMQRRIIRENLPAPNSYHVKGSFDRFLKNCKCDPYAVEPPPFAHTAKRFDGKESDIPGPGTYDPKNQTKCIASNFLAPFGTYASRFKKVLENDEPSPCDYHSSVGNLAYESQKRYKYSYLKPPSIFFNQFSMVEEDHYVPNFVETIEAKKHAVYHAAFKCKTERFPTIEVDVPDPGAYEVLTAFKANRDRCDVLRRRAPFGSRVSRLPRTQDDKHPTPDPTSYEMAGDISMNVKGGLMFLPSSIDEAKPGPGPTHYCIHPYHASSMLKKSFNVKLGKPKVIKEMIEKEKSRKARCPCTRKTLRWFTKYDQTVCI